MSKYKLALASFCVFLGISLVMLGIMVSPAHGSTDCKSDGFGKYCYDACTKNPMSSECQNCMKACQEQCAAGPTKLHCIFTFPDCDGYCKLLLTCKEVYVGP
ncbi:MAG: hypothetical protein FJ271_25295 [Planctomycetes bacterium]|nr:hypothetical protein [Planctomycetota bacterium]